MQGMRYINREGEVEKVRMTPCRLVANSGNEVDQKATSLPQFGWVTNKLYKVSLIEKNGLNFTTATHIHEDRIFNLRYMQYVSSMVMLPTQTYCYAYNPQSLTRNRYDNPLMFLYTAEAMDSILKMHKLGKVGLSYTARFCARFYLHSIGCCLVYPLHILSMKKRFEVIGKTMNSMYKSTLLKDFKLKSCRWLISDVLYFIRRLSQRLFRKI